MDFGTHIPGAKRINPINFPLTFHVAPPADHSFHLSSRISQHLSNGLEQFPDNAQCVIT